MKLRHFETLKPQCPVCRRNSMEAGLVIGRVLKEKRGGILEGILLCSNPQCLSEFPIVDGIPIIVADLRTYVSCNILSINGRNDFTADMESLIGDCCGPGSAFDANRQSLSVYAFDHYGDFDPEKEALETVSPGSILNLVRKGLDAIGDTPAGPVIDIGCATGRTSFELAEASDGIVLGVDLNFDMLRTAARILEDGIVKYPRRRVGMVYDRREFPASFMNAVNVDFWVCDAVALPFKNGCFQLATSFNVIDCLGSPREHLNELARILADGGRTIIATPYDWSATATPVEAWLGGHSQRAETQGSSETIVRGILGQEEHSREAGFRILSEIDAIPWQVRVHGRGTMMYQAHMLVAELGLK